MVDWSDNPAGTRSGAVAVLDALGFKGIWRSAKPEDVAQTLRSVESITKEFVNKLVPHVSEQTFDEHDTDVAGLVKNFFGDSRVGNVLKIELDTAAFSDTLFLLCSIRTPLLDEKPRLGMAALTAMLACNIAIVSGALATPPITYRGAIAAGDFYTDLGRFFIGPAIDEAASSEREPDGSFTFLTPSALTALRELLASRIGPKKRDPLPYGVEYAVPLKGGRTFRTVVANPFGLFWKPSAGFAAAVQPILGDAPIGTALRDRILSTFASDRLDVAIKEQNTRAFLDYLLTLSPPSADQ